MRLWHYGIALTLASSVGWTVSCAAGNPTQTTSTSSGSGGAGGGVISGSTSSSGAGGFMGCTKFSAEAKQAPAAMLMVLDRTASMANSGKWSASQLAIVQAIDNDVFDTMSLGLLTFPEPVAVAGPQCIFGFPIYCGVSGLPQVPINEAGTQKTNDSTGVRHDIYQFLTSPLNGPITADLSDSSPIYDALNNAYNAIKFVSGVDKRIVVLITDGGGSCTSISNPMRPSYFDNNGCPDWEQPKVMNDLIAAKANDPMTPINTFVIGVPGSDSTGVPVGGIDTPPYNMLLALSTYAVSGSPGTVDPMCDKNLMFAQNGPAPAKSCHFDFSNPNNFNPAALADAIQAIRGKALGCVYDLPPPPMGQQIDKNQVNVNLTINGATGILPKRSDPNDACTSDGCWDYDATDPNKVVLIGKSCADVSSATDAKVEIVVGCNTVLK